VGTIADTRGQIQVKELRIRGNIKMRATTTHVAENGTDGPKIASDGDWGIRNPGHTSGKGGGGKKFRWGARSGLNTCKHVIGWREKKEVSN